MPELGEAFRPAGTSFAGLTRARSLPVMLTPAAVGGALAWTATGEFSWPWFALWVVTVAAGRLAVNVADDVSAVASGADAAARADGLSAPTASVAISSGEVSRARATAIAAVLVVLAAAAGIWIGVARTWSPLILGAVALTLSVAASGYGHRVPFSAEVAAVLSAGVLPCAAAYATQARALDAIAYRAGVVPGLMLALVLFHESFLHHRSDRQVGRPGTVSFLGARRAIVASALTYGAAFAVLLWQILAGDWPGLASIAVVGALPLVAGYRRLAGDPESVHAQLTFLGAAVGAAAVVNAILALALVIDGAR